MRKAIVVKEIPNRCCFYPSGIHFTNRYCTVGTLALANLPTGANYGTVVVLYELE